MRRARLVALAAGAVAFLSLAGTASAHQLFQYEFETSFNGADSSGGAFTTSIKGIALNQAGHRIYVLDEHSPPECCGSTAWISQFNLAGEAVPFSGLGGVSSFEAGVAGSYPDLVFDNSGHEGGLYSNVGYSGVVGWKPDGTKKLELSIGGGTTGLGVDEDGTLYVSDVNGVQKWDPFDDTHIQAPYPGYLYEQQAQHITVDTNRYVYTGKDWNEESRQGTFKYYRGEENINICCNQGFVDASSLRFSYVPTPYTTVDRSDNDIFAVEGQEPGAPGFGHGVKVTEYSDLGQPVTTFGLPEGSFGGLGEAKAVAVDSETHKVYVTSANGSGQVDVFKRKAPITVPDVSTTPSGHPSKKTGILKGTVNADGVTTTGCKFEWGGTTQYTSAPVTCEPGTEFEGTSDHAVEAEVSSLTPGTIYHYRVAAKNANEQWSYSPDHTFEASLPPTVSPVIVDHVNTDGARFSTVVNPEGGTTSYHFELGEEDCSSNPCTQLPASPLTLESRLSPEQVFQTTSGLHPDTHYYVRAVAENETGQDTFTLQWRTYPSPPEKDPCPNAHVRQQTSAFLLPDCRAYELVSAANAGGYEVESTLVPGQAPYPGYPSAHDRVLYSLHFGSLPGIAGEPPNFGRDPYVAERTENGWVSRYVGLPGAGMPDPEPYGSPVLGADAQLNDFAFGGDGICSPCFNGLGTNLPLRLEGGPPQPGMVGSKEPGASAPEGVGAKYLSADGSHLVFGSKEEFEEDGAGETPRIYERDLKGGGTQIVSTDEEGHTLTSGGVAELDLSSDGSHVLIGKQVSKEAGDTYYQLYMHVGNADHTVKLTQGAPSGAIFDGMTADGSKVFFTTLDNLAGDTDESADIFEVEVAPDGSASAPRLISVNGNGTPSNYDGCHPPGEPDSWNAASGDGKCNAVAFADGAGVASGDGTFYFVSPEQLDGGEGIEDQANLYVVRPEATAHPHFVGTIDSSLVKKASLSPNRPVENADLVGSTNGAEAMAIDQPNGDIYVDETGAGRVSRYTEGGAAQDFTAGAGAGTNHLEPGNHSSTESGVAVDSATSSPLKGDFYVTNGASIKVFANSGEEIGTLDGSATPGGSFGLPCGVATEQATGALYVADYGREAIWRYEPKPTASAPIDDSDYTVTGVHTTGMSPCVVAADSAGHAYAMAWSNGPAKEYDTSLFSPAAPASAGSLIDNQSQALGVDPVSNTLFVNEGNQIAEFSPSGELIQKFGAGSVTASRGVAVNTGHQVFAPASGSAIVSFGYAPPPFVPIDNPAVVHGANEADTHRTSDFQVTPDGRYAVFSSLMPLTGFMNLGHYEIYRYDTQEGELECASCAITGSAATHDTFLSPEGLNVSDDGRVFFTTDEALVLTDTNGVKDAYEWAGGRQIGRLSTGGGVTASELLTASADGRDAFFFTRNVLVPSDENGSAIKIYDAREGGGFPFNPTPLPCAASDECHGAGSQTPPPPNINSTPPSQVPPSGEPTTKACKKGFVRRRGKCVKKHRTHASQNRGRKHG